MGMRGASFSAAQNFSVQGKFGHFGREKTRGDSDITGATPQPRSAQVG
jgi:hypothetical protein